MLLSIKNIGCHILSKFNQQHKDLFSTLINRLWGLIAGPISMLMIPLFLSPEQQGYWYLFGSLSALSIFADLGFTNIILQFSAHEYAFLEFIDANYLDGNELCLKKLGSFFCFVVKWILNISIIVFPIIYIIGIVFFIRDKVLSIYFLPWTLYAIGSLLNFCNNSVLSFIEGLDKIAEIQKIRFIVAVINTFLVVSLLFLHCNIYALAFSMLLSSLSIFFSLFGKFNKLLKQLISISAGFTYSWHEEIMPLFAKYVLSYVSGYFIMLMYTPLMHYFHGPIYSGKVGLTNSLVMVIFNISNIWMYTIIPKINIFISKKSWEELDRSFLKRILLTLSTYLALTICLFMFIFLFKNLLLIQKIVPRFLPVTALIMLLFCYFFQTIINSIAIYLRGHKKEPLAFLSFAMAVWVVIGTYIAAKYFSIDWFYMGFLSSEIWAIPVIFILFNKYKKEWHTEREQVNQSLT
jgi:O-antigen/teichoic acid export membrane protein